MTDQPSFSPPTATDNIDPSPVVSCSPESESNFDVNADTTVTCTATDDAGNTDDCNFVVTVGMIVLI